MSSFTTKRKPTFAHVAFLKLQWKLSIQDFLTVAEVVGSIKWRAIISNGVTHILKAIIAVLNRILVCFIEHASAWLMRTLNVVEATIYEMDATRPERPA